MSADTGDKTRASAAETAMKSAMVDGVSSLCDGIMTADQYEPDDLGQNMNRATAVGLFEAMRTLPVRLPSYAIAGLPSAASHTGAIVYCTNGAAGNPCVAFSDGSNWKRTDTGSTVS